MRSLLIAAALSACAALALTALVEAKDDAADQSAKDVLPSGSVSSQAGLEAWTRIEAVVTHPRCANCHVDAAGIPMWTPAGETKTRAHGMNIHAGESRIGAETIACSTCHITSTDPNEPAPAPLRSGIDWQLAPVEFLWFDKTGAEICEQLKDAKRNGGRDTAGLLEHLRHDASLNGFIPRAWQPGAGRSTPPGSFEDHVKDVALWGAAGQPCPR
ncbi:hypothetical protein F6X51_21040 [Methylobacterium planeticum]|uniref:Uncharacterized protein n=2 Tax=Methylobacterium planeticum TaxID=2615211 RepID=A0A6N6MLE4_9HYPH|nr:hypothetical protein F6X51_21040 [Methylobacterium planeticum]